MDRPHLPDGGPPMKHRQHLLVVLHDLSTPLPPIDRSYRFTIWDHSGDNYQNHLGSLRKNRGVCTYCGGPCGMSGQLDHMIPVSRGGLATKYNLVLCCRGCNTAKGSMTAREYLRRMLLSMRQLRLRWRKLRLRQARRLSYA